LFWRLTPHLRFEFSFYHQGLQGHQGRRINWPRITRMITKVRALRTDLPPSPATAVRGHGAALLATGFWLLASGFSVLRFVFWVLRFLCPRPKALQI